MPTIRMRLPMPSKRMWGQLSICGAIVTFSTVLYMHWRLGDRVRNSEYYRLAIQTLRQHKGAVGLLGEPIKESGFSLSNIRNTCDANKAQFQVSVHGTKDKGTVFFWATNRETGWLIDRLELETKQHPHTRFLLKKPQPMIEDPKIIEQSSPNLSQASQIETQKIKSKLQEKQPEQQTEIHLDHQQEQEHQNDGYETTIFDKPNSTCAQPLHQQQGHEPLPYIETAEGGRMQ